MLNALLGHSTILLACINQLSVLKTNFGLLFDWPLKTGFTVYSNRCYNKVCYIGTALNLFKYCFH